MMMHLISWRGRAGVATMALLVGATVVWASSATFALSGKGISLGEGKSIEVAGKELQRHHAKAVVGAPFTLTAQGMVLPRGGKAQPGEPDSGSWQFDEKQFKILEPDAPADKTTIAIRLEPKTVGTARVRFNGKILGYDRAFEVSIDIGERP